MNKLDNIDCSTWQLVLKAMQGNPKLVLQRCEGVKNNPWWWIRIGIRGCETKKLNGNTGRTASKHCKLIQSDWRTQTYSLDSAQSDHTKD